MAGLWSNISRRPVICGTDIENPGIGGIGVVEVCIHLE